MTERPAAGIERLELRIERLQLTFRFTFAFHAREVRFECDRGDGYARLFPETFSFRADQHDPTELYLQLDDLLSKPQVLSPRAHRRDAAELITRLLSAVPRYLERVCIRAESEGRLDEPMRLRMHQDLALVAQILLRFEQTTELDERRSVRVGGFLLTKLMFRSLMALVGERVDDDYMAAFVRGEIDLVDPSDDSTESGFFHILEAGTPEAVNRIILRMAERSFYLWVDGVCLQPENQAFEKEDSPFESREAEILAAISAAGATDIERGADLSPFLRRKSRDCVRVLDKLETWFLRRYDIAHSSAVIRHRAHLERGIATGERKLSWHRPSNYVLALGALSAPFVVAIFAYDRAPLLVNVLCSLEVLLVNAVAIWYLAYQFCWKRDLTIFHASVPRIGAGIIVGFLPVFLIDEVWGLAERDPFTLLCLVTFLGLATLLFIYVEIQGKLGDSRTAFERARGIFLLGTFEAASLGLVMTGLVGRFMVSRNWSPDGGEMPIESLRLTLEPLFGQLPRIVGIEPFYAFPSAVLMMTFLSFFIGIFLQLMWEELPITEPL